MKLPFANRIQAWFLERSRIRRGPVRLPFRLEYRHIYILPTAFGLAFGLMLVFMALGGLNFNNNMALLLVFLLAAITQTTTLLAYRNLIDLSFESVRAEPVFASETAHFKIFIGNREQRDRFTLQAGWKNEPPLDCVDLGNQTTGVLTLSKPARQRGWLEMGAFRLETRFPLGMFRAWSYIFPTGRCLVYPAPANHPPPLPQSGHGRAGRSQVGAGEQVHGLRKYRYGDPLKRVAWRASARHNELYSREMESPEEKACELSWNQLNGLSTEQRLSVLTAWVLMADHRQLTYSLKLPDQAIPYGAGPEHRATCLQALALYG